MLNTLYAALVAACLFVGYSEFALWVLVPLGSVAVFLFFLSNRAAFQLGMRGRGLGYVLTFIAGNVLLCAVAYFVGWGAGRLLA